MSKAILHSDRAHMLLVRFSAFSYIMKRNAASVASPVNVSVMLENFRLTVGVFLFFTRSAIRFRR